MAAIGNIQVSMLLLHVCNYLRMYTSFGGTIEYEECSLPVARTDSSVLYKCRYRYI